MATALTLFGTHGTQTLNALVRKHTGFETMQDMIDPRHGNYRPSIHVTTRSRAAADIRNALECEWIANAYDALCEANNDPRRAFRS